jgi:hypothetical protein
MNLLSFRLCEIDFPGFVLVVDDQPLAKHVGSAESAIPYWLVDGDLSPAHSDESDECFRIIGTCTCGDFGCGGTMALITKSPEAVTMTNFTYGVPPEHQAKLFSFTRSNYDQVLSEMSSQARMFAAAEAESSSKSRRGPGA